MWLGKVSSLQELSFNLIVKEFGRFFYAFSSSEDEKIRRHLEFLQRRYSNDLAAELHSLDNLKEEYCNFLINEHLTFLYDGWLVNTRYLNFPKSILCCLPNLTSICYTYCENELMKILAAFCPKVTDIDVRFSNISDSGLRYLCRRRNGWLPCPKLKNIVLRGTLVTERGVERLIQNIPSLERVDYRGLPMLLHRIHQKNLYRLKKVQCSNLVELDLSHFDNLPHSPYILESCFSVCPKLESFACNITNREMVDYFIGSHLKELDLKFSTETKLNIDEFLKVHGCSLNFLSITNCTVSLTVLAIHCSFLKEIEVCHVDFTDDDVDLLPSFSSLTACTFQQVDVSAGKAVSSLLSCTPNLENISFIASKLSLEIMSRVLIWCKRPSAKIIDFQVLELQMEFLTEILLSCPSLKQMYLTSCKIGGNDPEKTLLSLKQITTNKPEIFFI